ncbi:hypothetical protein ACHAW5_009413 [Stephanodiscus triporus]|uniref:AFG1-like ATPase n=1 Tax=Stephanodiscus triporus TaxID=2934178 RepID=A0ABD3PLF4_9STRA
MPIARRLRPHRVGAPLRPPRASAASPAGGHHRRPRDDCSNPLPARHGGPAYSSSSSSSSSFSTGRRPRRTPWTVGGFRHPIVVARGSSSASARGGDDDDEATINDDRGPLERYESLARSGTVKLDAHQVRALTALDRLWSEIMTRRVGERREDEGGGDVVGIEGRFPPFDDAGGTGDGYMSIFDGLFSWPVPTDEDDDDDDDDGERTKHPNEGPPRGVYIHGGVGCGKTFCMNLFYDSLPGLGGLGKQKVHFHKFMLNVHRQMHLAKMMKDLRGDDVFDYVVRSTVSEGKVLCFDEFQVTDVADALILKRLFTGLIDNGTIIVATSNRPPGDLYKGGLQRDLFLPFIDLLEEKCAVVDMWESEVDYRLIEGVDDASRSDGAAPRQLVYFADDNQAIGPPGSAKKKFVELFRALTRDSFVESMVLDVGGRQITIPQVSEKYGIARFSFDDLCRTAKGAADYLAIGERFNIIFVEDVPKLESHEANLVRRWITLIDAMYECRTKWIWRARMTRDLPSIERGVEWKR